MLCVAVVWSVYASGSGPGAWASDPSPAADLGSSGSAVSGLDQGRRLRAGRGQGVAALERRIGTCVQGRGVRVSVRDSQGVLRGLGGLSRGRAGCGPRAGARAARERVPVPVPERVPLSVLVRAGERDAGEPETGERGAGLESGSC